MIWTVPAAAMLALAIGQSAAPPLAAYVGKYAHDKVRGVTFLDHPVVRKAVARAASNRMVEWQLLQPEVTTPISAKDSLMLTQSCEAHNCPYQTWAVLIDRATGRAALCYYDEDLTGDARWFVGGERAYRVADMSCPHDVGDVPAEVVAALAADTSEGDE